MPESDTWPGSVAMESMTSMDSAGSCDSVVSVNSVCSDDSLEYLSAEERACLMFLEETIESLEAEEDSGLSNDEPEDRLPVPDSMADKMVHLSPSVDQNRLDDVSKYPYDDPMREPGNGHKPFSALAPSPLVQADSGSSILPKAGMDMRAQTVPLPATSTCLIDLPPDRVDLVHQPINISPDINLGHQRTTLEDSLLVIPPPTDFRDEPGEQEDLPRDGTLSPRRPMSQADMVQLLKRSVSKDEPTSPIATDSDESHNGSDPPSPFEVQPVSPHEFDELKNIPPVVAPKPKRLPSNIILKAHKGPIYSPVSSPDQSISSSSTSPNHMILMDPQKVRMEALRKLGLLKDDEADLSPTLSSPLYSPKLHSSWEVSPVVSPVSPDLPQSSVPEAQFLHTVPPPMVVQEPRFSEYRERSSSDLPTLPRPSRTMSTVAKSATLERMGSGHSYLSVDETPASTDQAKGSLAQLRNTRPRPASLGNGNDFRAMQSNAPQTAAPVTAIAKSPESGDGVRHLHGSSSQKLPRSQGISVLITPRSSGQEHREALRKLGLLKD